MSTSLSVYLVFGYVDRTSAAFGGNSGEHVNKTCLIDPISPMNGKDGYVLFAESSRVDVVEDRDGYDIPEPAMVLPPKGSTALYERQLREAVQMLPEVHRPVGKPQWILVSCLG